MEMVEMIKVTLTMLANYELLLTMVMLVGGSLAFCTGRYK